MRPDKYITIEEEIRLTKELGDKLLEAGYNASNCVIVTVSTDYSSHVGMWLRHHLSYDGEICEGFGIDVPYPDEVWNDSYVNEMYETFKIHAFKFQSKTLLFVEAGVIRGGNYTFIVDWLRKRIESDKKIITLTLYENKGSNWKSDFVGDYYNDENEDLTFWWERPNNHWKK